MSIDPEHGIGCGGTARLRLDWPGAESEPSLVELRPGRNLIGRSDAGAIAVDHPSISQAHCEIELSPDGAVVRDLGSTNGTFINDEPVQESVLQAGQRLRLGEVEFVFERPKAGPSEMPSAPATPLAAAGSGLAPALCVNHTARATWRCTECGRPLCAACVKQVKLDTKKTVAICSACAGLCERFAGSGASKSPRTFAGGMLEALAYPFQTVGVILLGAVVLLNLLTSIASRSPATGSVFLLLGMGAAVYVLVYLRQVLMSSTDNDVVMPDFPELDLQVFREAALQFIGVYLVCFGPWTLCTLWLRPETGAMKMACHALLGLGAFYFPMALLAVVLYDSLAALNPLLVLLSIAKTFFQYAAICLVFAAMAGALMLLDKALAFAGSPVLTTTVSGAAGLYAVLVSLRVLGWFYFRNKEHLDWN